MAPLFAMGYRTNSKTCCPHTSALLSQDYSGYRILVSIVILHRQKVNDMHIILYASFYNSQKLSLLDTESIFGTKLATTETANASRIIDKKRTVPYLHRTRGAGIATDTAEFAFPGDRNRVRREIMA
jgi:hypothetical protein